MKKLLSVLLLILPAAVHAQTIDSAGPFFATAGDYFTMTVEMSGPLSNPYNIILVSSAGTISPWSSYNPTGNTYIVSYLLRDYEKTGNYYLTYGSSTYPTPIRISRPLTPEKFEYQSASALNIPIGTGILDGISHMQTDGLGNLYCVGNFTGTCTINGQSVTASGSRDGFIAKFNSAGILVWIRKTGSSVDDNQFSIDGLNSVEIYQDSVIYVTGYMWCDTSLKFNGSTPMNYPSRNNNTQDGVVMKIDSAGNFKWVAFQGSLKKDATNDVEVDANGSLFVTGYAQSEDFSSSGLADTSFTYVYNSGATDSIPLGAYANEQYGLFVAKYTSSGQLVWARRQTRDYFTWGSFPVRMELCADNSLVILSKGSGQVKWDGTGCTSGSCCNPHFALLKLDSLGNRLWCLEDGNFVDYMDMGIDSADNIYVTLPTAWTGGDDEAFLRKYSSAGNLLWNIPIQHNKDNTGNYVSVTDEAGNTYVSHSYQHLWASNPRVLVTKKFDNNGQLMAVTYPEPIVPYEENKPTAITLSAAADKVFLAGHFRGSQRFGNTTLSSATRKPFLLSMNNCPVSYDSMNVNTCGTYITPSGNQVLSTTGYYSDTLMNAAGCDSIIMITLNAYAQPVVSAAAQGATSFCQGDSVVLVATPGQGNYQWYNRTWLIAGATSSSYTAKTNGRFYCIAQNAGVCADTSNNILVRVPCIRVNPPVDKISAVDGSISFEVFPNPGTGIFTLSGPSGELTVYDAVGRSVYEMRCDEPRQMIDLTGLNDGIYLFSFRTGQQLLIKRVQVVK